MGTEQRAKAFCSVLLYKKPPAGCTMPVSYTHLDVYKRQIIYILSPKGLFPSLYKMAEVICFIFPAFMECLILARLLPSNDSYMDLWQVSSAGSGLMDFEGNIFYSSEKCLPVKKEQIITAKRKTVLLSDEQTILRSHEVSGGWGFWYKDISDILKLNRNLEDVGDVLVEENALLEGAISCLLYTSRCV